MTLLSALMHPGAIRGTATRRPPYGPDSNGEMAGSSPLPSEARPQLARHSLRDLYGMRGPRLNELVALLRETRRLLEVK